MGAVWILKMLDGRNAGRLWKNDCWQAPSVAIWFTRELCFKIISLSIECNPEDQDAAGSQL